MKLLKFNYLMSQAKKNMCRNGLMTAASLFTITCCLLILGVFTILTLNIRAFTAEVQDQCEIQLFIESGTGEAEVNTLKDQILAVDNVKEVSLFTKQDMLDYVKEDMFSEKEYLLEGLEGEENPFDDSYKIRLVNIAYTDDTTKALEQLEHVDHVVNEQGMVNNVLTYSDILKKISMGIMCLLLLISVVIISNTVKLTVFNRRKEISIMKYIGATDRFIRVPFVFEGILIGVIGAVVAFGLISWGYIMALRWASESHFDLFELIRYPQLAPITILLFLAVGCVIGVLGSAISMKKYLHA